MDQNSYPEFGANPSGDQDIDLTQGRMSRDKQIGNIQPESKSVKVKKIMIKVIIIVNN